LKRFNLDLCVSFFAEVRQKHSKQLGTDRKKCLLVINRKGKEHEQEQCRRYKRKIFENPLALSSPSEMNFQFIHYTIPGKDQNSTRNLMKKGSNGSKGNIIIHKFVGFLSALQQIKILLLLTPKQKLESSDLHRSARSGVL
jgi:hypothetical protein